MGDKRNARPAPVARPAAPLVPPGPAHLPAVQRHLRLRALVCGGLAHQHQHRQRRDVIAMIEWGSENWGGNVHYASNGSWVTDKHGDDDANVDD